MQIRNLRLKIKNLGLNIGNMGLEIEITGLRIGYRCFRIGGLGIGHWYSPKASISEGIVKLRSRTLHIAIAIFTPTPRFRIVFGKIERSRRKNYVSFLDPRFSGHSEPFVVAMLQHSMSSKIAFVRSTMTTKTSFKRIPIDEMGAYVGFFSRAIVYGAIKLTIIN